MTGFGQFRAFEMPRTAGFIAPANSGSGSQQTGEANREMAV